MITDSISNSVSAIIGYLFTYLQDILNVVFISNFDYTDLASLQLAQTVINMVALGVYKGLNNGIETFVSQSYGAGKQRQCGIYLN